METPTHQSSSPGDFVGFAREHTRSQSSFLGCSRISEYEVLGKLGEGTFGEVHRAKSKKTGAIVALKKILMHNEKDGFPITALREIKLLKLLSHQNVLSLMEMAVEHPSKPTEKRKRAIMYMVTPYMDHDLSGLLENPAITLTEPQIKCYLLQLLEGLRYLHDNHILHRDMKAANLLINNKGILQIADFGLARHYDEPVPVAGNGGGEARREYTTLVVTRWYRPPELLLHLRKYTTAIDMWGVGCVFGEMLTGKPILAGDSDANQLKIIFELVGTPTDETMPGWKHLPGAEGLQLRPHPATLSQRFREAGSGAISLLTELLKLDWRKRVNAIDALKHPYFKNAPLPAIAGDLPIMEDSHELDRRKFRGQKAAPPPAPKGGTVGIGEPSANGHGGFGNGDRHFQYQNTSRQPYAPPGMYGRNGVPPPPPPQDEPRRRPAWEGQGQQRHQHDRPDNRLPPRPPPADYPGYDGARERSEVGYRSRSRDLDPESYKNSRLPPPPRSRGPGGPNVDTYIPSYGPDSGRREDRPPRDDRAPRDDRIPRDDRLPRDDRRSRDRDDRPRDDRPRRREERDDRRQEHRERERDRDRLDYDERRRSVSTRSRSRSPVRDRERDRVREREPLERPHDRERDVYRR